MIPHDLPKAINAVRVCGYRRHWSFCVIEQNLVHAGAETELLHHGLVLGGARSGKSAFAEKLVLASGRRPVYFATSQVFDGEMEARVDIHRQRRGDEWTLVEEPLELVDLLANQSTQESCILVDCLTLWITNLMMAERAVDDEADRLVALIESLPSNARIVFVSNEVGQGIVPMNKMARDFRDHAGRLHQKLAAAVPNVWFVTAGLPQKLK
ncbi:bifunctional adenosylcobinamide kinase/adenosylcobinamide-phosphate guanylyltransferase [Ahrensia sp. R2A130]|uniref:bifunctional adenosylcobinamide kinase/adenosylcobinamide-phosphate guanylyltransferase n=1 Tax=Ahrensia sp. R2A130 TaxID=744979 RepID=UPI0001E0AC6E|nr:bifunctional adenosylcobinamide kinase/adenosylcobinamide-phosphate guanylyltransferase [Ahrensia sp. R2A130]EFL90691.1 cobalbumin biosynthesis enzyme [Ahrensia sp. R2A130]